MGGMSRSTAWQLYFPESGFKEAFAVFANRENDEFVCNTAPCLFFSIINGWHEEEFGSHFVKNFSGRQHPFR